MKIRKVKAALLFMAVTVSALSFQNCSNLENKTRFSDHKSAQTNAVDGGDSYDGKPDPGDYYRLIPDYKCKDQPAVRDIVYVRPGSIRISTIDPSTCARNESPVISASLKGSHRVPDILSVRDGVFEKRPAAPDLTDRTLRIVENWCSSVGMTGPHVDVVVRLSSETGAGEATVATDTGSQVLTGLNRTLSGTQVQYSAAGFSLNVTSGLGQVDVTTNGQRIQTQLKCMASGRLDPVAPVAPLACPVGYLKLPALAGYTANPYCLSKFEARDSASGPQSTAQGLPRVNVSRDQALAACQSLGLSYDLVSNAEWQSTARHIESIPENWSDGVIGSGGGLSRGHSDNIPNTVLTASTDDNQSCVGTGQTCSASVWDGQRRTFRLGSGDLIWDLAGNADEWIKDTINKSYGPSDKVSQIVNGGAYASDAKDMFGPAGNYLSLNTAPFGGLGMSTLTAAGGAVRRGAGWQWNGVDNGGLFNVYLWDSPSVSNDSVGFRCVYHP